MSVTTFLALVLAPLALVVTLFVIWPLLFRRSGGDPQGAPADAGIAVNRAVVAERRAQLDAELAGLPADSPERARRIAEFSQAALQDLEGAQVASPAAKRGPRLAWGIGLALVLLAAPQVGYRLMGTPEWLSLSREPTAEDRDVARLAGELERKMAERPEDPQGWLLLGRTRLAMGDLEASRKALERALALDAPDPGMAAQIRVDLADVLARADGRAIPDRAKDLIREALGLDPRNPKGLALAGAFAAAAGDAVTARRHWKQLAAMLPAGSEQASQVRQLIGQLPAPDAARITGQVSLEPGLSSKVAPDDAVFIAVRALSDDDRPVGPPVAVMRATAADLPLSFSLDDSNAMAPTATLSSEPRVMVVARVSRSGAATAAPGDIEGRSGPVANDATGVEVRLDRVLP